MCHTCDHLINEGNDVLNEILDVRRNRGPYDGPSRHEMLTADTLLHCLDPEEVRHSSDVQEMCLALAVAVERLATLEESVTS